MNFLDTETSQYCSFASIYHSGKIEIKEYGDGFSILQWAPLNGDEPEYHPLYCTHSFMLKCDRVEVETSGNWEETMFEESATK